MKNYDVAIIGGGVIGSAIARELSRFQLSIAVLEKNLDVCFETSGRNTGVCHGGFAYDPGSLKAKFCVEGNQMMGRLAEELDFGFKRCGKVLVGNTEEEYNRLLEVQKQGETNGASDLVMVDQDKLHELVPSVQGSFALFSKNSGILDPFQFTIALAENAVRNGAEYFLDSEVTQIQRTPEKEWDITVRHREMKNTAPTLFHARWLINASGLSCGKISDMMGLTGNRILYSKDDYILLDARLGKMLPMPIYTVPSNLYMGVHVSITTDGNVLLGPTAEDENVFGGYPVAQKNIDYLYEEAMKLWPHFTRADYIRTYCGVLPKLLDANGRIQDFTIQFEDQEAPHSVNLLGIESPGLTASVAIARYVVEGIRAREDLIPNEQFDPYRKGIRRFAELSAEEQDALIQEDPDYGELICRCQKVSKAEILQAIHNPLGAHSMAGVKYRTRSMMGRCQGGYCQMRISRLLEQELGIEPADITLHRQGSALFFGTMC